jgi:hypothetical protein
MSASTEFKNVTLSGAQSFAVVRALRNRIDAMVSLHAEAVKLDRADLAGYALEQERDARAALVTVNGAALFFPLAEGMKP